MEIVKKSEEQSLTLYESKKIGSLITEEKLQQLRHEREIHQHKTIWTKDAHGGPYKKVRGSQRLS